MLIGAKAPNLCYNVSIGVVSIKPVDVPSSVGFFMFKILIANLRIN